MAITTEQVKSLRDQTGVSVMQCKKALEEADGDEAKALVLLRKQSKEAAEKKSDRALGAGTVQAYIHGGGEVGAMVHLSSETDFVSKNEEFVALAYEIAMHVAAANPQFKSRDEVTDEALSAAKSVFEDEAKDKPEEVREKVIQGKIDAYLKERVLLEQAYVKDSEKTIGDLLKEAVQKFGENIDITEYARFSSR